MHRGNCWRRLSYVTKGYHLHLKLTEYLTQGAEAVQRTGKDYGHQNCSRSTRHGSFSSSRLFTLNELNAEARSSILFIHGSLGDRTYWDSVTPYLSDYHLLLPDLPGHGEAAQIQPFSKQLSAQLLADLIRKRAKGGEAHIIAISLGAFVAVELASTYPDMIDDMFISGLKVVQPSPAVAPLMPYGFWFFRRLESNMPRSWVRRAMDGTDLRSNDLSLATLPLCRAIMTLISASDTNVHWAQPWQARTCIISAGLLECCTSSASLSLSSALSL